MPRPLATLPPLLFALASAHAQTATTAPPDDVNHPIGTIVFLVLFVGVCVGFFWFVWRNEQKAKRKKSAPAADGRSTGDAKS